MTQLNPTDADCDRLLALLERMGTGVALERMLAIAAGGLREASASCGGRLKALEGNDEAT